MRFQHRRYSSKARKTACTVATSAAFSLWLLRGGDGSYQMPRKKYIVEPADGQKKTSWFRYFPANKHSNGHPSFGNFPLPRYLTRVLNLIGNVKLNYFKQTKTSQLYTNFSDVNTRSSLPGLASYEKKHRIRSW